MSGRSRSLAFLLVLVAACFEHEVPPYEPPAPYFVEDVSDNTCFEGQRPIFRVSAVGTSLTYQWFRDGEPIPGATSPELVLGPVEAADSGAALSAVVWADRKSSAESRTALLTVHPPVDLRFKWIGAPLPLSYGTDASLVGGFRIYGPGIRGPMAVGEVCAIPTPYGTACSSDFLMYAAPSGVWSEASNMIADPWTWSGEAHPGALVTSIAAEPRGPGESHFAGTTLGSTQRGGFTAARGWALPEELGEVAAAEGAAGRVITAAWFDAAEPGYVDYLAYRWSEAPDARYEAEAGVCDRAGLVEAATDLGARGYVVTAFGAGAGGTTAFVLVGTRPEGAVEPHPVELRARDAFEELGTPAGHVPVGAVKDTGPHEVTFLFQR